MWEIPPLEQLLASVQDPSNPIGMRMRAAYFLRSIFATCDNDNDNDNNDNDNDKLQEKQTQIIGALSNGLQDTRHGSLMRHEFAYVMGQIRDERFCPALEATLQRRGDCSMVRHEAAEALGAIGAERSIVILQNVMNNEDAEDEVLETCQIALNFMEWRKNNGDTANMPIACACMLSPYSSVDPAPPHPSHANMSIAQVGLILSNVNLPLFERYRAMFSLRNMGGTTAVQELCRVLVQDDSSALLRHEVAYVLGQMQHPASIEALEQSLRRINEHKMVRHESAEALGAIEGRWDAVEPILNEFCQDKDDVVRESCLVALDAADYWGHNNNKHSVDDVDNNDVDDNNNNLSAEQQNMQVNDNIPVTFAKAKAAGALPTDAQSLR